MEANRSTRPAVHHRRRQGAEGQVEEVPVTGLQVVDEQIDLPNQSSSPVKSITLQTARQLLHEIERAQTLHVANGTGYASSSG